MAPAREEVPVWQDKHRGYGDPVCLQTPLIIIAGQVALSDRSVSRRHLTVEVGEVGSKDCVSDPKAILRHPKLTFIRKPNMRTRSRVTLEDLKTKHGTTLNGEQIRGQSCVLQKDYNAVVLARCEFQLRSPPFFLFPSTDTHVS
jgi:FHA domain